jgi:hypothetical protein
VAVWLLAVLLAVAVVAVIALVIALVQVRRRAEINDAAIEAGRAELAAAVEEATEAHVAEIRRTLARERAETASAVADDERRLAAERRAALVEQQRQIADDLAEALAIAEARVDERLRTFRDDFDRALDQIGSQVVQIEQRQREALGEVEARIEADAAELGSTADEQRQTVLRLREELETAASTAVTEALDELADQVTERRRTIDEISDRLRIRESAIAEGIDRAESDAKARLEVVLVEFERRQAERLERQVEREVDRHVQAAVVTFDARMREIREEAAKRLERELERRADLLAREEFTARLDQ